MARKKKVAPPENHERWMVSYADFITLLFATFTALFAISSADLAKLTAMRESIQQAFSGGPSRVTMTGGANKDGDLIISISPTIDAPPKPKPQPAEDQDGNSLFRGNERRPEGDDPPPDATPASNATPAPTPTPTPTPQPTPETSIELGSEGSNNTALMNELREMFETAGLDKAVDVKQETRGTVISLGEAAFFAPGELDVLPQSVHKLDRIMNLLRTRKFHIRVEGHTDDTPVRSGRYRDNMELSVLRATRVCRFMSENYGFDLKLLSPAGYGEYRPKADNSTTEGRQKNRRIDIVILNEASAKLEP